MLQDHARGVSLLACVSFRLVPMGQSDGDQSSSAEAADVTDDGCDGCESGVCWLQDIAIQARPAENECVFSNCNAESKAEVGSRMGSWWQHRSDGYGYAYEVIH